MVSMFSSADNGIYRYQQWVVDAWRRSGGTVRKDIRLPKKLRALMGRLNLHLPGTKRRNRSLLVCASWRVESVAWPWTGNYDIIPIMWDVWPGNFEPLVRFARRNRVKLLFCTSSQQAMAAQARVPGLKAVWLPEAVDVKSYPMGGNLRNRSIDILEFGRCLPCVHDALKKHKFSIPINYEYPSARLIAPDFRDFTAKLRNAKMVVCYPKCDTNPQVAGGIETLTQRYWECMSSGALVVGRAPKELIDICGYNPVIELGDSPVEQIESVLTHIENYEELARRNRACAESKGDWSSRMVIIDKAVQRLLS